MIIAAGGLSVAALGAVGFAALLTLDLMDATDEGSFAGFELIFVILISWAAAAATGAALTVMRLMSRHRTRPA